MITIQCTPQVAFLLPVLFFALAFGLGYLFAQIDRTPGYTKEQTEVIKNKVNSL